MANLKLALRTLFKSPFVTIVAIASLALGIGANAAIYSLFDQVLLRALPVRAPEQLVNLASPGVKSGSISAGSAGSQEAVFSYPMFRDLERMQTVFTGIAAHRSFGANLAFHGQTLNTEGTMVSGSYFPLLGVTPSLGRLLGPSDDQAIGANYVAVLGYTYWETKLGANPNVVGQQIVINGHPMTIVGVAPRGFQGTTLGSQPAVYVPLTMHAVVQPWFTGFTVRRNYWAYLFARLKPGVTIDQARKGMNAIYKPIIADVEAPLQEKMSPQTLARFKSKEIVLEPGARGQSSWHTETRTPLIFLFSITGIVLIIACANIANLLLARGASRGMEMAVRLSFGATRRQLLVQLLTESLVLAGLGGAVSLIVARWTLGFIGTMLPPEVGPIISLELQLPTALFAAALAIGTGVLFGLFPALHSTRPDLVTTMRANTGQLSSARSATRFRTALVTAQIALSMMLLVSAGLFIKSLRNVSRVDLGLKVDNVITFGISPTLNGYPNVRTRALLQRVEEELSAIPGVTSASASMVTLLVGDNWGNSVSVQGWKNPPDGDNSAQFNGVGPAFFRTLSIPVLAGREFLPSDVVGAPRVVIVNEAFTKKFGLGREAVGKLMATGGRREQLDMTIVGVVQNAKYSDVKDEIPPTYYVPYRQDTTVGSASFYVRTSLEPTQVLRMIPPLIARLDSDLPVENLKTVPQVVRENVFFDRMISILSSAFAALATVLAAVGLYGVLAYTVARRTREIGVRMALGADASRVRGMVLRQVGMMTLVGGAIGIAGALALGQAASSLLYRLSGYDPVVLVIAVVSLTAVALGAGYLPALRASRVDPMQALRYE